MVPYKGDFAVKDFVRTLALSLNAAFALSVYLVAGLYTQNKIRAAVRRYYLKLAQTVNSPCKILNLNPDPGAVSDLIRQIHFI